MPPPSTSWSTRSTPRCAMTMLLVNLVHDVRSEPTPNDRPLIAGSDRPSLCPPKTFPEPWVQRWHVDSYTSLGDILAFLHYRCQLRFVPEIGQEFLGLDDRDAMSAAAAQVPGAVESTVDGKAAKRRAACDECRTKKLKCTGEHPQCSRCNQEKLTCVYSFQKQMGRPKKRPRTEGREVTAPYRGPMYAESSGQDQFVAVQSYNDANEFGSHESAFAHDRDLRPWLDSTDDWGNGFAGSDGYPVLTADSALNMPSELQSPTSDGFSYNQNFTSSDPSTHMLLNPTLPGSTGTAHDTDIFGMPQYNMSNCACLSTMYLTLNSLQSMETNFTFPLSLHPLREAMQTAATVLSCDECPTRFITATQNTQLLGTLLKSIAERFSKVLEHISCESIRATLAGETKKFRLADLNTRTSHLHAGGLGCQAAFSVNLSPEEWRTMCKKVVRAEVYGPSDGNDCCPYLLGLAKHMEERQKRWYDEPMPQEFPLDSQGRPIGRCIAMKKDDRLCLKLAQYSQILAEGLDFS
ncbi:hypothetical protein DOTSEDRAFT_77016 [Dothistroma septosporum NZE10]|uniref:Zn(2)-C6 fungal-type domain-containing protein n=1 Tax=Dothistroma septosporum (strain NZE10 / CBS 128990) TaxID=675120 RepID=N1Q4Y6_DOTSN|nr:hypothetical protein DOTSEDRAFT_77016 [Dothistroma septosporum NZE10]